MIFISKFSKPSLITYFGIIIGVVGISFATVEIRLSLACLFICAVCDFFDGRFARRFKRTLQERKFGIVIDSLADTLAFVALPCVILFAATSLTVAPIIVAAIYSLCGITRLTVFTAEADPDKKTEYYSGLPILCAGAIIPLVYSALSIINSLIPGLVSDLATDIILLLAYLALAALYVLNIKVKKP